MPISVLSGVDGFANLPKSRRSILIADDAVYDLTHAMADAIKDARSEFRT